MEAKLVAALLLAGTGGTASPTSTSLPLTTACPPSRSRCGMQQGVWTSSQGFLRQGHVQSTQGGLDQCLHTLRPPSRIPPFLCPSATTPLLPLPSLLPQSSLFQLMAAEAPGFTPTDVYGDSPVHLSTRGHNIVVDVSAPFVVDLAPLATPCPVHAFLLSNKLPQSCVMQRMSSDLLFVSLMQPSSPAARSASFAAPALLVPSLSTQAVSRQACLMVIGHKPGVSCLLIPPRSSWPRWWSAWQARPGATACPSPARTCSRQPRRPCPHPWCLATTRLSAQCAWWARGERRG